MGRPKWKVLAMTLGPLDLVTIQVRDWPKALAWYRDVLGLTIVAIEESHQFCLLGTGENGALLGLASDHPEQAASTLENRLAPGFRCSDVAETLRRLQDAGVQVDSDVDGGDGYWLGRLWDPEGNRIHLYSYESA
jgi:predicted enzyme related to lactoylglutathione lyase